MLECADRANFFDVHFEILPLVLLQSGFGSGVTDRIRIRPQSGRTVSDPLEKLKLDCHHFVLNIHE